MTMAHRIAIRAGLAVGTLALSAMALPALGKGASAQETAAPAPSTTSGVTSAGPSDPAKMEEARRHFERGLILLRDPDGEKVEPAYLEFKAAHDLSKSPRVLGNIGYCAMRMERNTEAVAAYREYVRLVPDIDPAERAQIARDLTTMTEGAATINVRYTGRGAWTLIDERTPVQGGIVTNAYPGRENESLALLLHPGRHLVRVKVNGEEQGRWELEAIGGASLTHTFEPKPLTPATPALANAPNPEGSGGSSTHLGPIVMMGAGGVLLAVSAITGIVAYGKMKDVERECPGNVCPGTSTGAHDIDSARSLGTATDVLLVSGAVLAAGGALWLALGPSRRDSEAPAASVSGACVPGSCGVTMRGSF